ncbi:hypothetical protein NGF19_24350 [Streptomyces sp. RY43-2]|uniref:LPXTG cell wall anchor domain-containing protein n=1 Tax=Streptomyces macrolidinus TaxID=2952607 RepID=A0ABT0ZJV3_9ACTN|nr:hypothetical protein [Streptomyces macrolidinus]MCN9243874.1 hypothetical protein [Streptomyces macrolidinus]
MSAARRSSSTPRRTLLTATLAGTLLGALWFVPSAGAAPDPSGQPATTGSTAAEPASTETRLADTGAVDTTPYVVGGTLFLCLGAGFVTYSVRRERLGAS